MNTPPQQFPVHKSPVKRINPILSLTVIDLQSGVYPGEDDIVRFAHVYARVSPKASWHSVKQLLSKSRCVHALRQYCSASQKFVVPAKAGTQSVQDFGNTMDWIPVFAGMTGF